MSLFQNKYRNESARLQGYEYSSEGSYFITICTKNRNHYFGEILDGEMILNDIGIIANELWFEIINHYPFARLGAFAIMPNHIHGIIIIDYSINIPIVVVGTGHDPSHDPSLPDTATLRKNTVSNMVGSFKSAVTRLARAINPDFNWQTRFYDHIIRNQEDYDRIERYIIINPENWENDTFKSFGTGHDPSLQFFVIFLMVLSKS